MGLFAALTALPLLASMSLQEPKSGSAGTTAGEDHWTWRFVPYLFATNLEGTLAVGPVEAESEVEFSDLFESLDFGFMALLEGHRGRWGFAVDGAYVDLAEDGDGLPTSELDVTLQLLEGLALFRLTPDSPVELALGARYLGLDTDVQVGANQASSDKTFVDGIVGARSNWTFAQRWRFGLYGDVGAGDSDLTWQGIANLGYDFGAWGVNLGYRVLGYEIEEGPADFEMAMKGWQLGLEYRW